MAINTASTALVAVLALLGSSPALVVVPFLAQWAESAQAAFAVTPPPRPTAIGLRQLAVSTLFTLLFILIWR